MNNKPFIDYFDNQSIISYLCKLRARKAKAKSKKQTLHALTKNPDYNHHISSNTVPGYEKELQETLQKILPSRRKWKELGRISRHKKNWGQKYQKLSSNYKNYYALIKTIKYYEQEKPTEVFYKELIAFIRDIKKTVLDTKYTICSPETYPKAKKDVSGKKIREADPRKRDECRPISIFSLKDRIILSITNKFFTKLFDPFFEKSSFAFRDPKTRLSHHCAIKEILEYKSLYHDSPLWVAECDMRKFYDTVNHKIIKKHFNALIKKASAKFPDLKLTVPKRIFKKYLECYAFNKDVFPKNDDPEFWKKKHLPNGNFDWVEKYLRYKNIGKERIGVPQGGALSGLIANIVLDMVDKKLADSKVFYVRFCDDMIMMHNDKKTCKLNLDKYFTTLKQLKLVPHKTNLTENLTKTREKKSKYLPNLSLKPFWEGKSKGPYLWAPAKHGGFPWIGFVGYEMRYNGAVRVRKNSFEKEKNKQKKIIRQIEKAIEKDCRVKNGTILESSISKLIGMSVGRFDIWDSPIIENEMCWKNGFKELNCNKHSIAQIKTLDRQRNKLYFQLMKKLYKIKKDNETDSSDQKHSKARQIIHYNKPFSYYYQILERKVSEKSYFLTLIKLILASGNKESA